MKQLTAEMTVNTHKDTMDKEIWLFLWFTITITIIMIGSIHSDKLEF